MAESGVWVLSVANNDKVWRGEGFLESEEWLPRCLEERSINWMVKGISGVHDRNFKFE